MTLTHKIVAYDKTTERYVESYDVPPHVFDQVKRLASVGDRNPDAIGNYSLDAQTAQAIGTIIGAPLDTTRFIFYLEPVPSDD
jgi:hypothetical protein